MTVRIAYIAAMILLICANALQLKTNGHFANAKVRIAQLTANLPASADRMEMIQTDDIRNEHIQKAHLWGRVGFIFTGFGTLSIIVAMVRSEKGWYSIPILLLLHYGLLITTS